MLFKQNLCDVSIVVGILMQWFIQLHCIHSAFRTLPNSPPPKKLQTCFFTVNLPC